MKTVDKLLTLSGVVALAVSAVQCGNTTNSSLDLAPQPVDMTVPVDLTSFAAPTVSSITPSFGVNAASTALTVNGSGFRLGATVTVGGQPCSNPMVLTATSIQCTVPAKAASCGSGNRVVVTNPDAKASADVVNFTYASMSTGFIAATPATQTVGTAPVRVLLVDVSKDGKPDIISVNQTTSNVTVLLGKGDAAGGFNAASGSPLSNATAITLQGIAVADIDFDGNLDILTVSSGGTPQVTAYRGNGDGTFKAGVNTAVPVAVTSPTSIAAADFTGDSKADVLVGSNNTQNIAVLKSNGDGTFSVGTALKTAAGSPNSVALSDVNKDGKADVIVATSMNTVNVFTGNQDGTFVAVAGAAPTTGSGPIGLTVVDLDGDGSVDIATANTLAGTTNNVSVLFGAGTGSFANGMQLTAGSGPLSVASADLNSDGKPDLVLSNGNNNWYYLLNTGSRTFGNAAMVANGAPSFGVAVGDVNGDTLPDVVTTGNLGSTLAWVYLSQCK